MILTLVLPFIASAQNPAASVNVLNQLQYNKGDYKNENEQNLGEQKVEEKRTKLQEEVKVKVENILNNIYVKLSEVITKLNVIANKLDQKITELDEKGVNTGNSKTLLIEARTKIVLASSKLETSKMILSNVLETEVSKGDVRSIVEATGESIKSAHSALTSVIKELKDVHPESGIDTATTSKATSTQ
jgi:division protein CdvB (Snf7/Vps24/ESCRT-III family)